MSVEIRDTLKSQFDALNSTFAQNVEAVQDLQRILITDILPGLADELEWNEECVAFAQEWLKDTGSVFRILKRNRFTISFTLEALRTTLPWRLATLPTLGVYEPSPHICCLPAEVRDPFGRPIVVLQLVSLWESSQDLQGTLLHSIELMRRHLAQLNKQPQDSGSWPILQYTVLLDIGGMSFHGAQSIELLSWFVRDLVPKFPGLLAAAFVLNYSWAQAGLWNLAKRLLPASTLQKVFFPTTSELKVYLDPRAVPKDWGGDLPRISLIQNALNEYAQRPSPRLFESSQRGPGLPPPSSPDNIEEAQGALSPPIPSRAVLSSTSLLNPFFGYPVTYGNANLSSSTPSFQHGRRRKRDLFYTLGRLWWKRWRSYLKLMLFLLLLTLASWKRRQWTALIRRIATWKSKTPRALIQ